MPLTRRGLREIYVREGMDRGAKLPTADNNPEIERYGNGDTCIPLFTTPARNLTSNFTLPLFANFIRLSMPLLSCPRRERRRAKFDPVSAKPNSQRWEFATKLNCKQIGRAS